MQNKIFNNKGGKSMSRICPKCGREYSSQSVMCRFCNCKLTEKNSSAVSQQPKGSTIPQNTVNRHYSSDQIAEKPKNSTLGILALIFSILGCTFLLGMILAIIDLCKKDGRKKGCSMAALIIICIYFFIGIVSVFGSTDNSKTNDNMEKNYTVEQNTDEPFTSSKSEEQLPINEQVSTQDPPTEKEDFNIPTEYASALIQAESYSDIMHMSKAKIYDQLTSEYGGQFSQDAAQYAIDNISADWNANALANAENYNSTMHLSKQKLYDQLTSDFGELFTPEEAQYAIDNIEADWNANALATAKNYQDTMAMSPEAIRDQLTSEYGEKFTPEEAEYAISHLE